MLRSPMEQEIAAWFEKARRDLRAAAVDLAATPPLLDDAAFHCQQAAEKAVKGRLLASGIAFPTTHDIRMTADLVIPLEPDLELLLDRAATLTEYAWLFRYPGDVFEPSETETTEALAIATVVVDALEPRAMAAAAAA